MLREYALIADGERGALIGPDGAIVWLCAPRWDSPAVFSGLLGGPARYAVTPADPWHVWGGYYETGTPDLAQPLGRRVAAPSAGRRSPCPPTRTGRCSCAGSRRSTGPRRVNVSLDVRAGFGRSRMTGLATGSGGVLDRAQRRASVPLVGRGAGAARRRRRAGA